MFADQNEGFGIEGLGCGNPVGSDQVCWVEDLRLLSARAPFLAGYRVESEMDEGFDFVGLPT